MTALADAVRLAAVPVLGLAAVQDYRSHLVRRDVWYIIAAVAVVALGVEALQASSPAVVLSHGLAAGVVTAVLGLVWVVVAGAGVADGFAVAVLGLWWPMTVAAVPVGALVAALGLAMAALVGVIVEAASISISPDGEPATAIPFVTILAPCVVFGAALTVLL